MSMYTSIKDFEEHFPNLDQLTIKALEQRYNNDDSIFVSRQNWEAFVSLFSVKFSYGPDYRSSKMKFFAKLPDSNVEFSFEAYAMRVETIKRVFFSKDPGTYNAVKVNKSDFHFYGPGARSRDAWFEAYTLFDLLVS